MRQRMTCMNLPGRLCSREIDHCRNNGCDDDPGQLKPVEKGDPDERWVRVIVKRGPEQDDEGDDEQPKNRSAIPSCWTASHNAFSFVVCSCERRQ